LARENERLKGEISALRIYQAMAADAVAQLNAIQSLDTIPLAPGASMVKGRVIGYWPNEHRLTLNVGSNDGVEANRAVVAPEGLAGVVDTVSPDSCQVLLITSASTRVGGKIVRDVTTFGLIRGLTYESLGMEVKRDSPVETGDRVVTSGISEWILGGLPVGEVTQITPRPEFGTKLLVLFPGFKVSAGRYLGVLK
jgi:rod shape-determining protein MreC